MNDSWLAICFSRKSKRAILQDNTEDLGVLLFWIEPTIERDDVELKLDSWEFFFSDSFIALWGIDCFFVF